MSMADLRNRLHTPSATTGDLSTNQPMLKTCTYDTEHVRRLGGFTGNSIGSETNDNDLIPYQYNRRWMIGAGDICGIPDIEEKRNYCV